MIFSSKRARPEASPGEWSGTIFIEKPAYDPKEREQVEQWIAGKFGSTRSKTLIVMSRVHPEDTNPDE